MGIGLPIEVITWGSMLSLSDKALMTGILVDHPDPGTFPDRNSTLPDKYRKMPSREQTNRKRVISDKKILSKKDEDCHWRSCCGLTYKQSIFFGLYGKSIGRKYLHNGNFSGVADSNY